jgi:phage baseplate assembly protein W
VARSLQRWEPRLALSSVSVESIVDGSIALRLSGEYLGESMILEVST